MPCIYQFFCRAQKGTLRTFGLDGGLELGRIVTEELRCLLYAAVARGLDLVTTETYARTGVSQACLCLLSHLYQAMCA